MAETYYVSSESQLHTIAANVNSGAKSYEGDIIYLQADITLTEEWVPIGNSDYFFQGTFEGWGHVISGLIITDGGSCQGLFGYINNGNIFNVGVKGRISATGKYVGGICGKADGVASIIGCYNAAAVTGGQYVGGICGEFSGYQIKNCYNTGAITANDTGAPYVGGLAGVIDNNGTGTPSMEKCYSTGSISTGASAYYGAIMGGIKNSANVKTCYYDLDKVDIGGAYYSEGRESAVDDTDNDVIGVEGVNMKSETSWEEKDLNNDPTDVAWVIEDGKYPKLAAFCKNRSFALTFTQTKNWLTIVPNGNYSVPAGVEAYKVSEVSSESVTLTRVTTLNEGHAALLYCETYSDIEMTFSSTDGALDDYRDDKWLKGSHVGTVMIGGGEVKHFILSDGTFYRVGSGSLARGKVYLDLTGIDIVTSSMASMQIRFAGNVTGIEKTPDATEQAPAEEYDLSGRRVSSTTKGIIVTNGKKIFKQ